MKTKKINTMNKNIFKSALVLCSAALLASCSLDEYNPLDNDTSNSLKEYTKWYGLETKCYEPIYAQMYTVADFLEVAEAGTDLWLTSKNSDNTKELFYYESLVPNAGKPWDKFFMQAYSALGNCATVIRNGEEMLKEGNAENLDNIKTLYAEARFLRGYYHLMLTTYYGPITLVNNSVDDGVELSPKRNTLSEIYQSVTEDLKYAVDNLSITPFNNNRARASKKSAVGILCRAYVQAAGQGLTAADGESYWKKAADLAGDFVADTEAGGAKYGGYLYDDISDMWASANNRTNKEALWVAAGVDANTDNESWNYSNAGKNKLFAYCYWNQTVASTLSTITSDKSNYYYGRTNSGLFAPSKYLLDLYDASWDKRWENSFQTAFGSFSMQQPDPAWKEYSKSVVKLNPKTCKLYGINPDLGAAGAKIYPYVDCAAKSSTSGGNQYTASVWPKGETSGDVSKLVSVKNPYVMDYPVAEDENRIFLYLYKHGTVSEESKNKRVYACVDIDDLFNSDKQYLATQFEGGWDTKYGSSNPLWQTFPCLTKFQWNYDGVFYGSNLQIKNGDIPVMRAAEVYLIAAEACQKLGKNQEAANYINKLRKRSVRSGVAPATYEITAGQITEDAILDEFARELCGEHQRWALLQRHQAFKTQFQKSNKRAADSFKDYMKWRPISQTFLQQIDNKEEYGDNGYGTTATSGLDGFER